MCKERVILTCTSTKERLGMLFYMVESIKKQTIKPDIFYVNLSEKEEIIEDVRLKIPSLFDTDYIKINWVEDVRSYRKLIPVIDKVGAEDFLITADDDVLYGQNWIKDLVLMAEEYEDHIVCARAREMKKNIFGYWQNYSRWNLISSPREGQYILPTNGGGTVFRKRLLDLNFLLDLAYIEIAPTVDDLWFRMASLRKNVPV